MHIVFGSHMTQNMFALVTLNDYVTVVLGRGFVICYVLSFSPPFRRGPGLADNLQVS